MKTKYVCHGPISPHANFLVNRLVETVILLVKNCAWGKRKKSLCFCPTSYEHQFYVGCTESFDKLGMNTTWLFITPPNFEFHFENDFVI